jgi:hypothetical protein
MMKNKRIIAVALLIAMVCGLFAGCASEEAVSSLGAFEVPEKLRTIKSGVVAENDRMSLSWDVNTNSLQLLDKTSGTVYSTIPYAYYQSGSEGNNYVKNGLRSSLYITYRDGEKNVEVEHVSYKHSHYITAARIDNGVRLTYYFVDAEISVPVDYTLTEDGMSATVSVKEIREGKYDILSVSVLPFFCSTENSDENYLFVPSGSGALMMADEARETRRYSEAVYGQDAAAQKVFQNQESAAVRLPVYGAKSENSAMLAIITSGAEMATINAVAGDSQYGHSAAYATFALRGLNRAYIGNSWGGSAELKQYSADVVNVNPSVRYVILGKEQADYNGMAQAYRSYLAEKSRLKSGVFTPELMLTFFGGAPVRELFLGVPYETMSALTTLEGVQSILADIQEKTRASLAFNLKGFGSTGLDAGELGGGFEPDTKLGGAKGLAALTKWCKEQGIDSFYDFELVFFSESGSGFSVRESAVNAGMIRAQYYAHDIVTHGQDGDPSYLANRYELAVSASKIAGLGAKLGTTGVGIASYSSVAYSDYNSRNYYCKAHMSDDVQRMIKAMNAQGLKTFGQEANAYAAVMLDYIFDTPSASSGLNALDQDIPFYQMIFKGAVALSGSTINLAQDARTEFLKTVATGCSLGFTLCADADRDLLLGQHSAIGSSVYEGISGQIQAYTLEAAPFLQKVATQGIVSYEKEGNLSKTVFTDGTVVYVNYGTTAAGCPLGSVAPLSFLYS